MKIKAFIFSSVLISVALLMAACLSPGTATSNSANSNSAKNSSASNVAAKEAKGFAADKACAVFDKAGLKGDYEYDEKYDSWSCYASKMIGPEGRKTQMSAFPSPS